MEITKLVANNPSHSIDQISQSNAIFNKGGMRETEKTIIREQLLERWMSQKQLEVEVIKDMKLQWSKNSMPSDNLEAGNESIDKPPNGRILSEHRRRELEKRLIGEEILSNWLHRKQLEEEVMTEMFGVEMLQRVKNSIASENPEVKSDTCNKSPTGLQKIIIIQDKGEDSMLVNFIEMQKGEDSGLVPHPDGPMSLNGQERIDQSPANEKEGGLTGSIPIHCPPRAPNTTKPGMFIGLGRTATTPSKGEGSPLVPSAQVPAFLNGQSPVNDTDSGLNCSLPFQRLPRAPNNTNPEKLVDLGKEATTALVNSVTKRTSEGELNVDTPPIGGDNETAGKTTAKRKRWDCDLCCVITSAESVLQAHLKGKKHLAKLKASSETAKPPTSGEDHGKSIQEDNLPK